MSYGKYPKNIKHMEKSLGTEKIKLVAVSPQLQSSIIFSVGYKFKYF